MGGVINGQPVNQSVTNAAFLEKNGPDTMPYPLTLTGASGGGDINDIHTTANIILEGIGGDQANPATAYTGVPANTVSDGDNHLTALIKLAKKFYAEAASGGHSHDGTEGGGAPISAVSSIAASGSSPLTGSVILAASGATQLSESGQIITVYSPPSGTAVNTFAASGSAALTGAVTISASGAVVLAETGQNIVIYAPTAPASGSAVNSIAAPSGGTPLTGAVTLAPSGGAALSETGQTINVYAPLAVTLAASGQTPLTGNVTLSASGGITLTQSGQNIQIFAATGGGGSASPTTTLGDMIYRAATADTRLPIGGSNQVVQQLGDAGIPSWQTINQYGFPNYISSNPNAETDTVGWATYFNTAANIPSNGTGGTATGLTFSRSASSPLRGTASFSMVQANSTSLQGKGVSYDFTIDGADQASVLAINFDFNASTTFVAGNGITAPLNDGTTTTNAGNSDIEVFLYDKTNAVLIPVSPQVITANGANNFSFKGVFQTASNSTSYRFILHVATTSANAAGWTFKYDNVYIGRQSVAYGSPDLDWTPDTTSLTPNATAFGSISNFRAFRKRQGDNIVWRGDFVIGAANAAVGSFDLTNYLIDTTKISSSASGSELGKVHQLTSGVNGVEVLFVGLVPFYDGSTNNKVFICYETDTKAYQKNNVSGWGNATFPVTFQFSYPVAGWSSNVLMSNDTDTRVCSFQANKANGSVTANTTIPTWTNTVRDTHAAFNSSTGVYTIQVAGDYWAAFNVVTTAGNANAQIRKNGTIVMYGSGATSQGSDTISGLVSGCVPGDTITVSLDTSLTINSLATETVWSLYRLSGPASIATSDTVAASYYISAGTQTPGASTQINFDTKLFDTTGAVTTGAGAWKFTAPVAGKYTISGLMELSATAGSVFLYKNGTSTFTGPNYSTAQPQQAFSFDIQLLAGDFVDLRNGGNSSVWVGGTGPIASCINVKRTGN